MPSLILSRYLLFHSRLFRIIFIVFPLVISSIPSPLFASGLTVQPATFLFRDIPIGVKIKLPVPLSIHNKNERTNTYTVKALSPSRIGMSWPEGYIEIPKTDWFTFGDKEITVDGGKIGITNMYIEIPAEDAYYNQKWVIAVEVTTKVGAGESIALAVYPRFLIETENREDITGRPAGKTGIRPGELLLAFQPERRETSLEIYNNDTVTHTYTIRPVIPVSNAKHQSSQRPSPSYDWIPDIEWIVPSMDKVEIKAGASQVIEIHLNIPQSRSVPHQRWEVFLFVTPDKGPPTFARVLLAP